MHFTFAQYQESADFLRSKLGSFQPKVAMVLGSGLGFLGDEVSDPIAIDYTYCAKPLGVARLLAEAGFNVRRIYVDAMIAEEKEDFLWLQENRPELYKHGTWQSHTCAEAIPSCRCHRRMQQMKPVEPPQDARRYIPHTEPYSTSNHPTWKQAMHQVLSACCISVPSDG